MTWKDKAAQHAKDCLPQESCGLLAIVKGKETYFPCKNLANNLCSYFIIDPDDWAYAEDSGELIAIIHSHPTGPIFPSETDKNACEYLGLKWYIYSPKINDWHSFEPSGYKPSSIIGKTWIWGAADCWTIVVDYFKEKGLKVGDMIRPKNPVEMLTNGKFEKEIPLCNFKEVNDDIKEDDLLLMSMAKNTGCHVGIYLGEQMVLHHQVGRLSSRDLLDSQMQKSIYKRYRHVEKN
jgi:proteasome lid subunit RPN8/RPN11|tara:strand:+ start:929 stop:1633 length:705 start_codon:yes stop_codon:yes gene_type:complete